MEWKKIKDYENYSVSTYGDIKNDKTGIILKKFKNKKGYEQIHLYKNGKQKTFQVHRLVAEAFIPNPENKLCVDHINTLRHDNRVENLRWCTYKENTNNPLTLGKLQGENNSMHGKRHTEEAKEKISEANKGENHPQCRKVILLNTGEIFDYIKQAEEKYGVNHSNISKCCLGKYKSAGKDENGEN